MSEADRIGEKFCEYYGKWLADTFQNTPDSMKLMFSRKETSEKHVLCEGGKTCWNDSRFWTEGKKTKGRFCFTGKRADLALQSFLEFLIEEIEKRFKDLIYLEAVEERLAQKDKKGCGDKLIEALIGELLDREWLVRTYVRSLLEEKELPGPELLTQISAQKYERRVIKTKIYFYPDEYQEDIKDIKFSADVCTSRADREIVLDNLRTICKMMEMSGEQHGLIARKEEEVYYIEGVRREQKRDSALCIEFTGHLKWTFKQGTEIFFEYCEGRIRIPALEGSEQDTVWEKELSALKIVIPELNKKRYGIRNVEKIIKALKKQSHGTSIVFMDDKTLEEEKKRLGGHKRLYQMEPFMIKEHQEETMGISSIDGAVLADISGRCHAVGAILDGKSVTAGNPGRGARYNSLVNYVNGIYDEYQESRREDPESVWCFAVIISEDQIVNLGIPESLRKRMK